MIEDNIKYDLALLTEDNHEFVIEWYFLFLWEHQSLDASFIIKVTMVTIIHFRLLVSSIVFLDFCPIFCSCMNLRSLHVLLMSMRFLLWIISSVIVNSTAYYKCNCWSLLVRIYLACFIFLYDSFIIFCCTQMVFWAWFIQLLSEYKLSSISIGPAMSEYKLSSISIGPAMSEYKLSSISIGPAVSECKLSSISIGPVV